jgi:hypothetical protein
MTSSPNPSRDFLCHCGNPGKVKRANGEIGCFHCFAQEHFKDQFPNGVADEMDRSRPGIPIADYQTETEMFNR